MNIMDDTLAINCEMAHTICAFGLVRIGIIYFSLFGKQIFAFVHLNTNILLLDSKNKYTIGGEYYSEELFTNVVLIVFEILIPYE